MSTISTYVTAEDYLERERAATDSKSEWVDGEVREMVGGSHDHIRISGNLLAFFRNQIGERPLDALQSEMKVRVPDGPYYYPDVVVIPDPPTYEDDRTDIVLDPLVVVEVLSPSTEEIDKGEKLDNYRRISSLTDYLIVDQFRPHVHRYHRQQKGWGLQIVDDLEGTLPLPSVECELPLSVVYERLFPEAR